MVRLCHTLHVVDDLGGKKRKGGGVWSPKIQVWEQISQVKADTFFFFSVSDYKIHEETVN